METFSATLLIVSIEKLEEECMVAPSCAVGEALVDLNIAIAMVANFMCFGSLASHFMVLLNLIRIVSLWLC